MKLNILSFTVFLVLGVANYLIYFFAFRKFNKNNPNYYKRDVQNISKMTKLIYFFQNYYGIIALLYFTYFCFWATGTTFSQLGLTIGITLSVLGLMLQAWSLRHLNENFSPCHEAKVPEKRIASGPYQYVSHPIYLSNFIQFIGLYIANNSYFFLTAILVQIVFYYFSMRDENKALDAKFGKRNFSFINTLLILATLSLLVFVNFIFPLVSANPFIIIAIALFSNSIWALLHEGVHAKLLVEKSHNDFWSRVLSILFGTTFLPVKFGHLAHHKYSRLPEEQAEVYTNNRFSKTVEFYFMLFFGMYFFEVVLPLIAFLPSRLLLLINSKFKGQTTIAAKVFEQFISKRETIRETRIDAALLYSMLVVMVYLYRDHLSLLFLLFGVRAFMISFFDYVYHYNTPLNDATHARNLAMPKWVQSFILNFNLHGIHHQKPNLPWYKLPLEFKAKNLRYDDHIVKIGLKQLNGPIHIDNL